MPSIVSNRHEQVHADGRNRQDEAPVPGTEEGRMNSESATPHVVIVGGGFGGLQVLSGLAGESAEVTIIDQKNHHLFQPLLYQVATAMITQSEVAWPIRHLVHKHKNVTTMLAGVVGVDYEQKKVLLEKEPPVSYDILVLATGSSNSYFGHDDWEPYAPGLKSLEDATAIRGRLLTAFEEAEWEPDAARREELLTFAVIGAGPTGVELAGTIAELARDTLRDDYRHFDTRDVRVVLIEAGQHVLSGFDERLSDYAQRALENLGVTVKLGHAVSKCDDEGVELDGKRLPAKTILWAAGVAASPAGDWLGVETDRAGRVLVNPDMTVPGHEDIYVIGDTAHVESADGKLVPGIAPAAKQQGKYVAEAIKARLHGKKLSRPFRYKNAGTLATIGKRAAVIDFGWIRLKGHLAWWIWGIVHIYFLIGMRNRLAVALNWLWIYVTQHRSARLITKNEARELKKHLRVE